MEAYLPISFLNDFIFCPRSIYFHQLYGRVSTQVYHQTPQRKGLAAHQTIDNKKYSSAKSTLQAMEVYSRQYNIAGKIDTFDQEKGILRERKKRITTVYDGYVFQIYAQYFALTEMGYAVKKLQLYSMDDNKIYSVAKPEDDLDKLGEFENLLNKIRNFTLTDEFFPNDKKCLNCIYNNLCDVAKVSSC